MIEQIQQYKDKLFDARIQFNITHWYNNLAISIKVNLNNPDDYKLSVDEYMSDAFIFKFFITFLRISIKNIKKQKKITRIKNDLPSILLARRAIL